MDNEPTPSDASPNDARPNDGSPNDGSPNEDTPSEAFPNLPDVPALPVVVRRGVPIWLAVIAAVVLSIVVGFAVFFTTRPGNIASADNLEKSVKLVKTADGTQVIDADCKPTADVKKDGSGAYTCVLKFNDSSTFNFAFELDPYGHWVVLYYTPA